MLRINENLELLETRRRLSELDGRTIKEVDLSGNTFGLLAPPFPQWFDNIVTLKLNGCKCEHISRSTFHGLVQCEFLSLDDNLLESLPFDLFVKCTKLRTLSARGNRITEIWPVMCTELVALENIDLSFNLIWSVRNMCLQSLKSLNLKHNLVYQFFENRLERLENLDLSFNRFAFLGRSYFKKMYSLEHVNVSNNIICRVVNKTFIESPKLKSLRLDNNLITEFSMLCLARDAHIRHLSLSNNRLVEMKFAHPHLFYLRSIDVSQNLNFEWTDIEQMPNVTDANLSGCFNPFLSLPSFENFPALQILNFSSNCFNPIPVNCFARLRQLKDLSLDDCVFENIDAYKLPFFDADNCLESLKMSRCNIGRLNPIFRHLKRLRFLDLSFNRIEEFDPDVFNDLVSLASLDLRMNHIETVYCDLFRNTQQLRIIDLRGNLLTQINQRIYSVAKQLKNILLDQNVCYFNNRARYQ